MAFDDMTTDQLYSLAQEHDIQGRSDMDKQQLIDALRDAGIEENAGDTTTDTTISGFQEGLRYPTMPRTPNHFAQLLNNPDKPPQFQSAPSPEQLNPHLFPERLP